MLLPDSWGSGGCAKDEVREAEVRIQWMLVNDRSVCRAATKVDPSQEKEWYLCGEQWVFPLIPIILVNVMIFTNQAHLFCTLCWSKLAVLIGSIVS